MRSIQEQETKRGWKEHPYREAALQLLPSPYKSLGVTGLATTAPTGPVWNKPGLLSSCLILPNTFGNKYFYFLHFTDENIEAGGQGT